MNNPYHAVNGLAPDPQSSRVGGEIEPMDSVMRTGCPSAASHVDGWAINLADEPSAIKAIVEAARAARGFTVFTLNLDHLVKLRTNRAFRDAYATATFVTADGAPVARLAQRHDPRIRRTTGADLTVPVCRAAADAQLPVFLFGSNAAVLGEAAAYLSSATAGRLSICGTLAPEANFDPEGESADAAIDQIVKSGARLCYVALGAPKQEIFAARAVARGADVGFLCFGAGLDFLSGAQVRAPKLMQNTGLEWLWRLASNPRRLATRYAQCALLLARLVLVDSWSRSTGGRRAGETF